MASLLVDCANEFTRQLLHPKKAMSEEQGPSRFPTTHTNGNAQLPTEAIDDVINQIRMGRTARVVANDDAAIREIAKVKKVYEKMLKKMQEDVAEKLKKFREGALMALLNRVEKLEKTYESTSEELINKIAAEKDARAKEAEEHGRIKKALENEIAVLKSKLAVKEGQGERKE